MPAHCPGQPNVGLVIKIINEKQTWGSRRVSSPILRHCGEKKARCHHMTEKKNKYGARDASSQAPSLVIVVAEKHENIGLEIRRLEPRPLSSWSCQRKQNRQRA